MEIERSGRSRMGAAKLGVAAVTDGEIFQPAVDHQINQRGGGEDAVRDQIAAVPIKHSADERADDDDGEWTIGDRVIG